MKHLNDYRRKNYGLSHHGLRIVADGKVCSECHALCRIHAAKEEDWLKCNFCGFVVSNRSELLKHKEQHRGEHVRF